MNEIMCVASGIALGAVGMWLIQVLRGHVFTAKEYLEGVERAVAAGMHIERQYGEETSHEEG